MSMIVSCRLIVRTVCGSQSILLGCSDQECLFMGLSIGGAKVRSGWRIPYAALQSTSLDKHVRCERSITLDLVDQSEN